MTARVTVAIPVLDEERHLEACLASVRLQTYPPNEILVIDGGSSDRTVEIATANSCEVLPNPKRIQAAALNLALQVATSEVLVRVDGHCRLEPDYIERCLDALSRPGVVMAGGAMRPVGSSLTQRAIALAMTHPLGAGTARFHVGGPAGPTDTVYLGAFRRDDARAVGGYREVEVNEDAEFAIRMAARGIIWFDPAIRSTYSPRATLRGLARQFYRYGGGRAHTVVRHPQSIRLRQLAPAVVVVGLLSPFRRITASAYGIAVSLAWFDLIRRDTRDGTLGILVLPVMHLSWGIGFVLRLMQLAIGRRRR